MKSFFLRCQTEEIPQDVSAEEWIEWCEERTKKFGSLIPVRGPRRAYDSIMQTYIWDAKYVLSWDGIRFGYINDRNLGRCLGMGIIKQD